MDPKRSLNGQQVQKVKICKETSCKKSLCFGMCVYRLRQTAPARDFGGIFTRCSPVVRQMYRHARSVAWTQTGDSLTICARTITVFCNQLLRKALSGTSQSAVDSCRLTSAHVRLLCFAAKGIVRDVPKCCRRM